MTSLVFLAVNLAVLSAFFIKPNGTAIVNIGEEKDITEANNGSLTDDILEPPNIQRSAIVDANNLWTSPVPYVLEKSLEMNAKGVILRAFEQFRLKSCIDFKQRDSEEYYISVQKLDGCFSYVGKSQPNGQQLSIGRFCDGISTVEHEFLHALGFFHEQSRYDRDNYVTVIFENIQEGRESNFAKVSSEDSTTNGVAYDFWSVMHYSKNAFSNGIGLTLITKDPEFQDIIGQRLEVSPSDILELNLLYKCNSTITFKMYCGFSDGSMCQMNRCSDGGPGWEMVTQVNGTPSSDHTTLPGGNSSYHGEQPGYFMHASTASGQEGDLAWLETKVMSVTQECHVQCLQFYYYHSGSPSDQLNIWIREFQDDLDDTGTRRLVDQITGRQTSYWQLQHVSLNATTHFQVEFEVRKGAGNSSGGFSIDDINLSETECPHVTIQVDELENLLNASDFGTTISSSRQYSTGGYSYLVGILLYKTQIGAYVQLLSGKYDDQLEWPCPQRQVTFQMLDQNPNIQQQMSKQRSITSDLSVSSTGSYLWDDPRKVGTPFTDENNETSYAGPQLGRAIFASLDELKSREFLKGGSAVFVFSFQDLTPLVNGSVLPCPKVRPAKMVNPPAHMDRAPCSPRILPTTPIPTVTDSSNFVFSPASLASSLLTLLLALMLLLP
uniref:meprin A subunit beta-like n=1 Tax=Scatophagus argus TaxID=75038 RepID=UPI001ED82935|nr:meprin A subunit beta-like [Scatophagus argus]